MDQAIGASLRLRRRGVGMSQEQLAEGLGVSGQQVRKYEAGRNRISASTLIAAARVLRVPAATLLPGDLPHDGDDDTSLAKALGLPGAPELLLAFALIRDARRRAAVICIAEGLAAPDSPRADRR
jgi:transcriptional regulator with XRE-family HTH domain